MSSEKKKILIVPSWYPHQANPTQGIFFQEQARLMRNAFDVRVLTSLKSDAPEFQATSEDGVRVYRFHLKDLTWLPAKLRVRFVLNQYLNAFKRMQAEEGWKPDLLHAHSTFFGGIYAYYLSRNTGIPYMITEHSPLDMDIHKVVKPFRYYALDAIRKATRMLAVSYSRRREIIWHLPSMNPGTIGNLVDETFFSLKSTAHTSPFRVLIVAQLNAVKDLPTFFQTAAYLKASHGNAIAFDVVGYNGWGGNNEAAIRRMAAQYGVEELCTFVGNADRSRMLQLYHSAGAFVLTSIAEGMPVSVLEALCTGTPVFSTRCGGAEEVIHAGNGAIVELKQSQELAQHISRLVRGEVVYDAAKMREEVVAKYGRDAFFSVLSNHYNELIPSSK